MDANIAVRVSWSGPAEHMGYRSDIMEQGTPDPSTQLVEVHIPGAGSVFLDPGQAKALAKALHHASRGESPAAGLLGGMLGGGR